MSCANIKKKERESQKRTGKPLGILSTLKKDGKKREDAVSVIKGRGWAYVKKSRLTAVSSKRERVGDSTKALSGTPPNRKGTKKQIKALMEEGGNTTRNRAKEPRREGSFQEEGRRGKGKGKLGFTRTNLTHSDGRGNRQRLGLGRKRTNGITPSKCAAAKLFS